MSIINKLHKSSVLGRVFHTLNYCLQKELKDCKTVLDLGCGPSSPLQYCKNVEYSVGVEAFKPYLNESKKKKIHTKYLQKKIQDLDFKKNSFDAVILIEVLEHLSKKDGLKILKLAQKWAKKKVIISTPNGFFPMDKVDNNIYQRHLSGWSVDELKKMNFKVSGVSGIKFFYLSSNSVHSLINENDLFLNIRFKPKKFFYILNALLQIVTHYNPKLAFGLFAVKEVN